MPERTKLANISALLFDIGGVVIDIDFRRAFDFWSQTSGVPTEIIRKQFELDPAYALFEIGAIDESEYVNRLCDALDVQLSNETFLEGWSRIFVELRPGIDRILRQASALMPIFALTNSNVIHWQWCIGRYADVLDVFEEVYVSFELGKRKPEPGVFVEVLKRMSRFPAEVLFLDDSLSNVRVARQLGMHSEVVKSLADIAKHLEWLLGRN